MTVVGRFFVVLFAYVLACIAASGVLTIGTLTPQWDALASLMASIGLPTAALWVVVGVGAVIIAVAAFLPALLAIVVTEGFGWRSAVIHGVLGGILALALSYGIDFARYLGGPGSAVVHEREVLAAAGIAGGLVYWVVAGRRAGFWR